MTKPTPTLFRLGSPLLALCAGLFLVHSAALAVTFSLTPAAVSNTYSGPITLQIDGLTNGETVLIRKYLDVTGNGVIDDSDWLVQQFTLTDGQAGMMIGGVCNSNVPGDLNPASGAITATLNFATGDFMQNVVGTYLFKLSSPGGHFAPLTNTLSVTNFPYGQQFTGTVLSNGTSTVVPNALVLVFGPPRSGKGGPGSPLAGTLADSAGVYSLPLPAGTYMPVAFARNGLASFATIQAISLASSQSLVTNLTVPASTATISGQLVDATNPSVGLPGIFLTAEGNGLVATGCSDSSGNFNLSVQAGQWGLKVEGRSLSLHGYLGLQNKTAANAGDTGVTLSVPRANALFFGSVKDSTGSPMVGMDVNADDNNGQYESDGYTDANGNYCAGAVGGMGNASWRAGISSETAPVNYIFSQPDFGQYGGTNLQSGTAVPASFTGLLATNHITGRLTNAVTGQGLANIGVPAWATINNVYFNQYAATDANGYYSNLVGNGTWTVGVNCGCNYSDCLNGYLCPPGVTVGISNNDAMVNFAASPAGDQISGRVLDATTSNGIPNVGVYARAVFNGVTNNLYQDTAGDGSYVFNVGNGSWTVGVNCNGGGDGLAWRGYQCVGEQTANLTNNNAVVNFAASPANDQITGRVLDVTTSNGIPNVGVYARAVFNGVTNNLYQDTAGDGSYAFNVANGSWTVGVNCNGGGDGLAWRGYQCVGEQTANLTNNNAVLNFSVSPVAPLQILSSNLPNGTVGVFYSQPLQASGASQPYSWWLPGGTMTLPPGQGGDMSFSTNGILSGVPAAAGTYSFWVGVFVNNPYQAVTQQVALTIQAQSQAPLADVANYSLMKLEAYRQWDGATVVPDATYGPFNASASILQSALDTVPIANVDLPSGAVKGFPSGGSGLQLLVVDSYASEAALEAAYTNGPCTFALATMHDGFQFPTLALPMAPYPAPQRLSNFAAAQAINPASPFTLQWTNPADVTPNDLLWVSIVDANNTTVFSTPYPATAPATALRGNTTSVMVPASTFQLGRTYTGTLTLYRPVSTAVTSYPGVPGMTLVGVQTRFSLAAAVAAPQLSQPARVSPSQFTFRLSGTQGQTYTVLASSDVSLPVASWLPLLTTNLSGSTALIQDNQATSQQRFYRVRVGP